MTAALALSPDSRVTVESVGAETMNVVVIDNCLAAPEAAVDLAASLPYLPIGPYYPGIRAALGSTIVSGFADALRETIEQHLGVAARDWAGECFFSIATTPPAALMPIQRLPHFDGLEDTRIAALLYLARSDFGGTSFYRHRATGFETVDAARYPRYGPALKVDVERYGLPPPDYIGDGAPIFEEIATFEPVYNRMLVYRGNALHCSRMKNAGQLTPDPRRGRLTLNLFLQPRAA
ncbi:MAG: DUF6445 family protein [Parvularculaceae bacterium]